MQIDLVDSDQSGQLGPKYSNWMEMRRGLMSEGNRFQEKTPPFGNANGGVFKKQEPGTYRF
jgi:hypothetical protein